MPDLPPMIRLDPLGAIISYLCVTGAVESGMRVPSSQRISDLLAVKQHRGKRVPMDPDVRCLWEDLLWINEQRLLFNERDIDPTEYFLPLAQRNVNQRIRQTRRGIHQVGRERYLTPADIVDKSITALRLIAAKDLYHFNHRELPHPALLDFLLAEHLIPSPEQFETFIRAMRGIDYIDFYPTGESLPAPDSDKVVLVEPTQNFRNQDLFLELRALDEFSPQKSDRTTRREGRMNLYRHAKQFARKIDERP